MICSAVWSNRSMRTGACPCVTLNAVPPLRRAALKMRSASRTAASASASPALTSARFHSYRVSPSDDSTRSMLIAFASTCGGEEISAHRMILENRKFSGYHRLGGSYTGHTESLASSPQSSAPVPQPTAERLGFRDGPCSARAIALLNTLYSSPSAATLHQSRAFALLPPPP